ncbi:coiled-coil domain-containing protein R3HCC1L-like [Lineus longissimus]|uniref:coiled-coil domain-containing protein R3HCC1L-like n=1 Tax=Lineus longissimus TaxID=88925 RepID=UPI002B4E6266
MAQSYGPNKIKAARGRGRARRYDAFEDRDCDGERDSYQPPRSSHWQPRSGDCHDWREGRSSPFQPLRPGDLNETRDDRVSPSGRSARNGPSSGSAISSRSRTSDNSYNSGITSEKKKSRQRRPEMQVYVPRGRRQLGASGSSQTRDTEDEPARRGSDESPSNQDENSSRPGSASTSRGRRVRAGAEPYVPRARRMQYHMSAADNENNENMCKQLLLSQGGGNPDDDDIGAIAPPAPPSDHYDNDALAMDVQTDNVSCKQTECFDSWDKSSVLNQEEFMLKENVKSSFQNKRKKSSRSDQRPENTDAQFRNSRNDESVLQSEQFDDFSGAYDADPIESDRCAGTGFIESDMFADNGPRENERYAASPTSTGPASDSCTDIQNRTVRELKDETQLNESSDEEASWEMAAESFGVKFKRSPEALADLHEMESEILPQSSRNKAEKCAEGFSTTNSLVEGVGPNSPETSFEIPRKDGSETEIVGINCPEGVQKSVQSSDQSVSEDIVNVSVLSSKAAEARSSGLESVVKRLDSDCDEFESEQKGIKYVPDDNQNLPGDEFKEKYKISDELITEMKSEIVACDSIKNEVTLCSSQSDLVLTTDEKAGATQCCSQTVTDVVSMPDTNIDTVTSSVMDHSSLEVDKAKDLPVSADLPVSDLPECEDLPVSLSVSEIDGAETAPYSEEIPNTQDSDNVKTPEGAGSIGELSDSGMSANRLKVKGDDVMPVEPECDPHSKATRNSRGKSADVGRTRDEDAGSVNADDEDSWDALFDDSGECLDSHLMDELARAVGEVKVEKPGHDYSEFSPKDLDGDYEAYTHLVEIYDFPSELLTRDLIAIFRDFTSRGFDIKWVDDTHAVGVFSSTIAAKDALTLKHPLLKVRPISEATRQTKLKAKRCSEFMLPYKPRPETNASCARRLVTGALGLNTRVSREQREQERKQLKDAREKKRLAAKQKQDAWDGTIDKCAMDET